MYCYKCGKELINGANFCPNCGNEVTEQTYEEKHFDGEEILRNLNVAIPIYKTITLVEEEIIQLRDRAKNEKKYLVIYTTVIVCSIILVVELLLAVVLSRLGVEGEIFKSMLSVLNGVLIIAGICLFSKDEWKNKFSEFEQRYNKGKRSENEANKKEQILDNYIKENDNPELYYLPGKYRYYNAAVYIKECIENKRAHNLTDAINLYEEQLHRWQVENYQQAMYILNQQQLALLKLKK